MDLLSKKNLRAGKGSRQKNFLLPVRNWVLPAMPSRVKTTRVDKAYARLKAEILNGELPPGFQAPEPDIAGRLGMSRTPVREALIRLEAERLVDLIPRRGAKILPISKKDICEIFEILAVLEALAASSAAKLSPDEELLSEIDMAITEAEEAQTRCDMESWALIDDRIHKLVARAGGNTRLELEIVNLLNQVFRANSVLLRMNKAPASNAEDHRRILEAVRAGQAEKASEIARMHRLSGLVTMEKVLQTCGLSHV